jgi:hypothetical protein
MAIAMRQCYTLRITRWRRFVAFINATKRGRALAPIASIGHRNAAISGIFHRQIVEKELELP